MQITTKVSSLYNENEQISSKYTCGFMFKEFINVCGTTLRTNMRKELTLCTKS